MSKYICKVWNADRSKKKAFMCQASIEQILKKAKEYCLTGVKLVLESDGTEIDDDETLQVFLQEKTTLVILNRGEKWISSSVTFVTHTATNNQNSCPCYLTQPSSGGEAEDIPEHSNSSVSSKSSGMASSQQSICDLFRGFEIPWAKMSSEITKALKKRKAIGKLVNTFVNIVVDELRQISLYIPMSVYRCVAQKAVNKYPDSFIEKDGEGNVLSQTPIFLITTMRNRNNFLNSAPKRKAVNSETPIKSRKSVSMLDGSCVNWQPEASIESLEVIMHKKEYLISVHQKKLNQIEKGKVRRIMADCYSAQRSFFNDPKEIPTRKDILENWPMIFHKDCLYDHFSKLMELDIATFQRNFDASRKKLTTFFNIDRNEDAKTILGEICSYFNENETLLFRQYEFGTSIESVQRDNKPDNPWISIIDVSPDEDKKSICYIWLEGEITSKEETFNVVDLVTQLLCYYYVFNIAYPKDISQSCEFLMRYFFKFYPSQVRGQKKHINNIMKINTFIRKLDQAA